MGSGIQDFPYCWEVLGADVSRQWEPWCDKPGPLVELFISDFIQLLMES